MAMIITEYVDHENVNAFFREASAPSSSGVNLQEAEQNSSTPVDPNSLMVDIEGIHAYTYATRNYTRYMPEALVDSVHTWTKPYRRPLIKHHNDKNGTIIGRVMSAEYVTHSDRSNSPALQFTVNVSDKEAIQAVKDGRLDTVSVSGTATDVRCSICGRQIADGDMCEHERGMTYETDNGRETCYWDIYNFEAKELSYVIVPADIYAKNLRFYPAAASGRSLPAQESDQSQSIEGENDMADPKANTELKEAQAKVTELKSKVEKLEEAAEASKKQEKELTEAKGELEKKVAELEESKKELEKKAGDLEESKKELEKKVAELEEAKKSLEDNAAEDKTMKEGLETQVADTKASLKESLIQTLQAIRLATGRKELDSEKVKERSEDSIRDSISDLKEEFKAKFGADVAESVLPQPESVNDPSAKSGNPEKGTKLNVKEGAGEQEKQLDLEAEMTGLFSSVLSARRA